MIHDFGGALIEEFIEGREFSVFVASNPEDEHNPLVFKPVECLFDTKVNFKTFDYKWKGSKNPWKLVEDPTLIERLQYMTKELFLAMGGEGYGRTDIRMDSNGSLYLLEINPNCSIFYPDNDGATADVILMMDGFGKANFLKKMIEFAFVRHKKQQQAYKVQLDPQKGNALFAAKDLDVGEMVYQLEEMPHRLVSKKRVDKIWSPRFKQFFTDYCWPISDDLWVMWDLEPDLWKPLNHSCDPNSWVDGLNLVARKKIKKGEEITMDYSTMYAISIGPQFKCNCGSLNCRGGWKPDDHKQQWFLDRYGDHVTDHVRQKQKHLGIIQ